MKKLFRSEVIPLSMVPRGDERGGRERPVVLVVDDEPLVAKTLALVLSGAGFTAIPVNSGSDALDMAQTVRPAFLLTDVHMPGMSGVELALTFNTAFPDCKVLLFSGTATGSSTGVPQFSPPGHEGTACLWRVRFSAAPPRL